MNKHRPAPKPTPVVLAKPTPKRKILAVHDDYIIELYESGRNIFTMGNVGVGEETIALLEKEFDCEFTRLEVSSMSEFREFVSNYKIK